MSGMTWRGAAICAIAAIASLGDCAGRRSDVTIAYRGDVAAFRQLVRVQLDTGSRARTVTPAFPSAARPERVGTSGSLPIRVMMLSGSDTIARYSAPPIALRANTSYVVSIIVSARAPLETRCTGRWAATPIVPAGAAPGVSAAASGSLYVSIASGARGAPRRAATNDRSAWSMTISTRASSSFNDSDPLK